MTGSQKRRARKAGRKALRAAEIQQMKEAQKDGVGVGKFEPHTPERTGARKRRRKVLFGGLGQRQRRGYFRSEIAAKHRALDGALGGPDRARWLNPDGTDRFPRGARAA